MSRKALYPRDFWQENPAPKSPRRNCFVLMPFAEDFAAVYQAIREAMEAIDFRCLRADGIYSSEPIMVSVMDQIQRGRVVIADLTGRNVNVFYELGITHCWKDNRRVILITQNSDDVPFDIRPFRFIQYDRSNLDRLKGDLILMMASRRSARRGAAEGTDESFPNRTQEQRSMGSVKKNLSAVAVAAPHYVLSRGDLDKMVQHSIRELPNMACGVIAGKNGRALRVYTTRNDAQHKRRDYSVDNRDLLRVYREVQDNDWDIWGIYSSGRIPTLFRRLMIYASPRGQRLFTFIFR